MTLDSQTLQTLVPLLQQSIGLTPNMLNNLRIPTWNPNTLVNTTLSGYYTNNMGMYTPQATGGGTIIQQLANFLGEATGSSIINQGGRDPLGQFAQAGLGVSEGAFARNKSATVAQQAQMMRNQYIRRLHGYSYAAKATALTGVSYDTTMGVADTLTGLVSDLEGGPLGGLLQGPLSMLNNVMGNAGNTELDASIMKQAMRKVRPTKGMTSKEYTEAIQSKVKELTEQSEEMLYNKHDDGSIALLSPKLSMLGDLNLGQSKQIHAMMNDSGGFDGLDIKEKTKKFEGVLETINAMAELTGDVQTSINMLQQTTGGTLFKISPNKYKEIASEIKEYAELSKQAGLSRETMTSILSATSRASGSVRVNAVGRRVITAQGMKGAVHLAKGYEGFAEKAKERMASGDMVEMQDSELKAKYNEIISQAGSSTYAKAIEDAILIEKATKGTKGAVTMEELLQDPTNIATELKKYAPIVAATTPKQREAVRNSEEFRDKFRDSEFMTAVQLNAEQVKIRGNRSEEQYFRDQDKRTKALTETEASAETALAEHKKLDTSSMDANQLSKWKNKLTTLETRRDTARIALIAVNTETANYKDIKVDELDTFAFKAHDNQYDIIIPSDNSSLETKKALLAMTEERATIKSGLVAEMAKHEKGSVGWLEAKDKLIAHDKAAKEAFRVSKRSTIANELVELDRAKLITKDFDKFRTDGKTSNTADHAKYIQAIAAGDMVKAVEIQRGEGNVTPEAVKELEKSYSEKLEKVANISDADLMRLNKESFSGKGDFRYDVQHNIAGGEWKYKGEYASAAKRVKDNLNLATWEEDDLEEMSNLKTRKWWGSRTSKANTAITELFKTGDKQLAAAAMYMQEGVPMKDLLQTFSKEDQENFFKIVEPLREKKEKEDRENKESGGGNSTHTIKSVVDLVLNTELFTTKIRSEAKDVIMRGKLESVDENK